MNWLTRGLASLVAATTFSSCVSDYPHRLRPIQLPDLGYTKEIPKDTVEETRGGPRIYDAAAQGIELLPQDKKQPHKKTKTLYGPAKPAPLHGSTLHITPQNDLEVVYIQRPFDPKDVFPTQRDILARKPNNYDTHPETRGKDPLTDRTLRPLMEYDTPTGLAIDRLLGRKNHYIRLAPPRTIGYDPFNGETRFGGEEDQTVMIKEIGKWALNEVLNADNPLSRSLRAVDDTYQEATTFGRFKLDIKGRLDGTKLERIGGGLKWNMLGGKYSLLYEEGRGPTGRRERGCWFGGEYTP